MKQSIWLVVLVLVTALYSDECHVLKSEKNRVKFISDAPIEDFEGVTDKIDGYLFWDGRELTDKSQLYFEVDLNTLDTGIGLRNRHMRENYLETDQYPLTWFKGRLVRAEKGTDGRYQVQADGTMFIHGVEQPKSVGGTITRDGDVYHITSGFEVKLSDYKIKIPSIMFYKIDETMSLEVDFYVKVVQK